MRKLLKCLSLILCVLILTSCSFIQGKPIYKVENESETDTKAETQTTLISETEKEIVPSRISFCACGDNIVYYGNVRDAARKNDNGETYYDFSPMFTDIKDIVASADIAFINQETLMCGEGFDFSYYPTFNGPQDMGDLIVDLGYDVVGMANNHMLDKGEKGLLATLSYWRSKPVLSIGAYTDQNDYNDIRYMEKGGIKIAFLSYTYGTNGISLPDGSETVVPYFDDDTIRMQTSKARENADFVIVSAHWGDEYSFTPNEMQEHYAKLFADCGVDLVIGHHPHVIQKIEYITSSDGSNKMLCAYSLGNFAAEMAYEMNMLGGILTLDIVSDESGVYTENVEFIPTVYYFDTSFYHNHIYLLKDFTSSLASSHGIKAYGNSITLSGLYTKLCNTIDSEYLPDETVSTANEILGKTER